MLGIGSAVFLGALIAIAVIALEILLGVWTYRDAESKGMMGILWTAIVILVPSYIGLIIYLVVRMDNKKVTCSNCNEKVNGKNKYCSNCGMELVPVVDVPEDEEKFKKSQKRILIGFFSTLGGIVIAAILMAACIISGVFSIVGHATKWATELGVDAHVAEQILGDLDVLLDSNVANVSVNGDEVTIKDEDGNVLIHIDGTGEKVDVNVKDIKDILDKYNIEYDEHDLNEEEIEQEIKDAIEDTVEDLEE